MDNTIRETIKTFLTTAQAHMTFVDAVKDFPLEHLNEFPPHVDYTPWMLLEHIVRTQQDVIDFMIDPQYKEPHWPDDYWPKSTEKADKTTWVKTIEKYEKGLQTLAAMVDDTTIDLSKKVKNGDGQTVFRELLLIIDHNSYHIGEFAILRQIMGTWPKNHDK